MTGPSQSYMHDWLSALCGGGWILSLFSRFYVTDAPCFVWAFVDRRVTYLHLVFPRLLLERSASPENFRIQLLPGHPSGVGTYDQRSASGESWFADTPCFAWAFVVRGVTCRHSCWKGGIFVGRGHELAHLRCGQRNCLCSVPNGGLCVVVPRAFNCGLVTWVTWAPTADGLVS